MKPYLPLAPRWSKIGQLETSTEPPRTMKSHFTSLIFWQPFSSLAHTLMHKLKMIYTIIQPSAKLEMKYSSSRPPFATITTTHITFFHCGLLCISAALHFSFLPVCVGMWAWLVRLLGPDMPATNLSQLYLVYSKTSFNWLVCPVSLVPCKTH